MTFEQAMRSLIEQSFAYPFAVDQIDIEREGNSAFVHAHTADDFLLLTNFEIIDAYFDERQCATAIMAILAALGRTVH